MSLSCRVVDEQQIERHFNSADLNELYVFEPDSHLRRPTPLLPKDRLLAELTIQRKDWIVTYHEHDSLLENKSEEELTEAERKAAWDDFENEKRGVNPMMGMMMNEMPGFMTMPGMPEILGGLAGRSVAGIPLSSIAAMIYNSNPGINQDEFLGRLRLTVSSFLKESSFFAFCFEILLLTLFFSILGGSTSKLFCPTSSCSRGRCFCPVCSITAA